jgi:hypothetical protein
MPRPKKYYRFIHNGKQIKAARVSSILSYCNRMEDSQGYINWVERQGGEKKAKKHTMARARSGSRVHKSLELFYENPDKYVEYSMALCDEDKKYLNSYKDLLYNYKQIYSELEIHYFKNGRAFGGVFDSYGYLNPHNVYTDKACTNKFYLENPLMLTDYKTKERQPKEILYVLKHCLQLGAYALGLEQTKGVVAENIAIFSASPRQLNIYYADKPKVEFYKQEFLNCLESYITKTPHDWKALEQKSGAEWNKDWNRMVYAKDNLLPIRLYIKAPIEF